MASGSSSDADAVSESVPQGTPSPESPCHPIAAWLRKFARHQDGECCLRLVLRPKSLNQLGVLREHFSRKTFLSLPDDQSADRWPHGRSPSRRCRLGGQSQIDQLSQDGTFAAQNTLVREPAARGLRGSGPIAPHPPSRSHGDHRIAKIAAIPSLFPVGGRNDRHPLRIARARCGLGRCR